MIIIIIKIKGINNHHKFERREKRMPRIFVVNQTELLLFSLYHIKLM